MNIHDYFYINVKFDHLKNEDDFADKAIEYVNIIIDILHKTQPDITYQTILNTLLDPKELLHTLIFGINNSTLLKLDPEPIASMLEDLSKDEEFNYFRFHFVFCGLRLHLFPKTKETAQIQDLQSAIYLGFKNVDNVEPSHLVLEKGQNMIFNLHDFNVYPIPLKMSISSRLSHLQGAIIIEQNDSDLIDDIKRDTKKFYEREENTLVTTNFDFDIAKVIQQKKLVFVKLPKNQIKKSEALLNAFSEKLLETLKSLPESNTPFNIYTFECERSLSDTWIDMLNQLPHQKQWVNVFSITQQPKLLAPRYLKEATYKFLTLPKPHESLGSMPLLESIDGLKDTFNGLESHQAVLIQQDSFTKLDIGF